MFDKQELVVQANKLIMAPQKFSYEEKRFLLCIISKINPHDEELKEYRIRYDEYASFVGQDLTDTRKILPKVTKSIMSQILEIEDDQEVLRQRAIITKATHYKKLGFVDVRIDSDMKEVLLDLKERFTQYKLENIMMLRSKHSIRLYEIIKANEFKLQKMFRLSWNDIPREIRREYPKEEIQSLLNTDYNGFADFERRVLQPVQKELAKFTDICFDYKKIKESRYVVAVDFYIKENIPAEKSTSKPVAINLKPEDLGNKTGAEITEMLRKKVQNIDRVKLCKAFQDKVKKEYGVGFQISMLEGVSNEKIAHVVPYIGSWKIERRTQHSVTKYIMKILSSD